MADSYEQWKARTGQAGAAGYDRYLKSQQQTPAPAAPTPAAPQPGTPAPAPGGPAPAAPTPSAPHPSVPNAPPAPAPPSGGGGGGSAPGGAMSYDEWFRANGNQGNLGGYNLYLSNAGLNYSGQQLSGLYGQGGTGTAKQQRTGAMAPGSFGDDSPDAGKLTGDPYLDELRSGRVAGSEDWRRFSNAQLKAWQPYYVGGGKFKNKYGDIVDKPDDRGPNTPPGYNGTGDYLGTGGGGGRGGAGGGSASGFSGRGSGGDIETMLQDALKGMLSGETRYTPEVMQGILAKVKAQNEGSIRRQQEEARNEAAGRGMGRAGRSGARIADIRRGAESAFTGQYADLLTKKVDADYQDKVAAMDRAQKYIDSLKLEMYRKDMTALQREQLRAQIAMAEANLRAQRENLQTSIQGQKDLLGAQFGYNQLGLGA